MGPMKANENKNYWKRETILKLNINDANRKLPSDAKEWALSETERGTVLPKKGYEVLMPTHSHVMKRNIFLITEIFLSKTLIEFSGLSDMTLTSLSNVH